MCISLNRTWHPMQQMHGQAYAGGYSYPYMQQHFVPSAAAVGAPPPPGWAMQAMPPPPGMQGGTAAEADADAFLNNYYQTNQP